MNPEILSIVVIYLLVLVLAIPLVYIGKIFNYEKTWLDAVFDPLDRLF
jgi:K+-transporting ATPase ATPase A chain